MNPGFRMQADAFAALVAAYRGREFEAPLVTPGSFTLVTLPAQLAAAEAVALGGSVAACMSWSRDLAERLPEGVVTALDWPVSVDRIRGLLWARAGRIVMARAAFARAVAAMEACGFEVEAAITRVQAAEVEAVAARRPSPATPRERARAAAALEALGLDPTRWAYPVSRALSGDRVAARSDRLTPPEVEVLNAFADDLSYRGAGERLGVSWRTVQSHATRAYRKLGVSGRAEALAEARRQRLIEPPHYWLVLDRSEAPDPPAPR